MQKTINLIIICLLSATNLFAQTKTFTRDYTYRASEADSKLSSRAIATTEMRNILLREVGTYIRTEQQFTGQQYVEKIEAITAGIVEMKVLEEKWDGENYYIKAQMVINPKEVEQKLKEIAEDKQKLKELEDSRARTKAAEAEIERLKKQITEFQKGSGNEQKIEQKLTDYNKQVNTLSAEEYFTKGYNARDKGNNKQAIEYYEQAVKLNPNYAKAYNNLGNAYKAINNYEQAIDSYKKAINLNPNYDKAYNNLGNAYNKISNYEQAIDSYKKAISLNPNYADAYYNLGNAYKAINNYDKAIESYNKAISLNPNDAHSYLGLALMYSGKGNNDKCFENLKMAAKLGNEVAQGILKKRGIKW